MLLHYRCSALRASSSPLLPSILINSPSLLVIAEAIRFVVNFPSLSILLLLLSETLHPPLPAARHRPLGESGQTGRVHQWCLSAPASLFHYALPLRLCPSSFLPLHPPGPIDRHEREDAARRSGQSERDRRTERETTGQMEGCVDSLWKSERGQ